MSMAPNPVPRLAIFGDSHYACLRRAHTEGLVDLSGLDLEYWGHVGRRFRMLEFRDGAIYPTDEYTADRFAKFNEKGRRFLPAADFDVILFMGCRIDLSLFFLGMLDAAMRGQHLSLGLRRAMLRHRLSSLPSYEMAQKMAAMGMADIYLHPVSLVGFEGPYYDSVKTDAMMQSTPQVRGEIWQFMAEEMAQDGITFIPQPEQTIIQGIYSDPAYITLNSLGQTDFTHRNAAYGALIYQQLLQHIQGAAELS